MRALKSISVLAIMIFLSQAIFTQSVMADKLTYRSIKNPQAFIVEQQTAAIESDKNMLWILGSQWCHDSRSLEQKLQIADMAPILEQHYQTSLIDVSYLTEGFDFTRVVGMDTFYATPTVLIIEPKSMSLINGEDMHIWSQAYKVSEQETVEYFSRYTVDNDLTDAEKSADYSATQQALFKQLNKYVKSQERRIKASYTVIGPMLKAYKDGNTDKNFDPYWNALAEIRMQLPKTIAENTRMIKALSEGESAELILPPSTTLPWE